ncbi:RadC family protein [Cellulosilyticum sp. I15G10I2]|uniref:RadC family protein n=1 Tax=Cellulosilyticum sp. I15G10I2 TaxID=1892843 RepID=UPI00085CBF1D|nr:DNA repair protein RadC [Cellulosilyticum sp. I15G10I2]
MRIQDKPLYSRPCEKFEKYGEGALTDIELLAILIRSGTKDSNAEEVAASILTMHEKEPSLISLYQTTFEELYRIKGIGKVKALQILALLELCRRITRQKHTYSLKVSSPKTISDYFMEDMRHLKEENFVVILLDAKCKMLGHKVISTGSLTASIVHPREVYKVAVQKSAHSIIVVHNHPSGDPAPSKEDIQITKRLKEAGNMMGIPLLDHIIIGDGSYISLKEENTI